MIARTEMMRSFFKSQTQKVETEPMTLEEEVPIGIFAIAENEKRTKDTRLIVGT